MTSFISSDFRDQKGGQFQWHSVKAVWSTVILENEIKKWLRSIDIEINVTVSGIHLDPHHFTGNDNSVWEGSSTSWGNYVWTSGSQLFLAFPALTVRIALHSPPVAICLLLMIGQIRTKPLCLNAWRPAPEAWTHSGPVFSEKFFFIVSLHSPPESPPFTPWDEFTPGWEPLFWTIIISRCWFRVYTRYQTKLDATHLSYIGTDSLPCSTFTIIHCISVYLKEMSSMPIITFESGDDVFSEEARINPFLEFVNIVKWRHT